jgi:hypothetical protein
MSDGKSDDANHRGHRGAQRIQLVTDITSEERGNGVQFSAGYSRNQNG